MDEYTKEHLETWLKFTIHRDEIASVRSKMIKFSEEHPELIKEGWSWPEIRKATERR
uniref:Uncharacterized protein n=1 Tax=viral metagenome TaxID=1070528 RepID=A0A6M3LU18_9ZZZZ